jgi:hypothetical protein
VYVVDGDNHRVQMFNSSLVYQRTLGVTGECGYDYNHFCYPQGVAVDSHGRVYVAGGWGNVRVDVFDTTGAYLTTIGGSWGTNTAQFRYAAGVAVDSAGNVYVTDHDNHCIQMFSPGVPGWPQSNLNGFGDPYNALVTTLAPFGGQLYAGTWNSSGSGAQLWRLDASGWASIMTDGFGDASNAGIDHLFSFNGKLYAGTWADETNGGEVWRSSDGSSWAQVVSSGFGDPTNAEIYRFAEFSGQIYASTWSNSALHGLEIWRSSTGDLGSWSRVVSNGFNGDASNVGAIGFDVFNGFLYAGTLNTASGGEVWRTANGTNWTQVNADGFGSADNSVVTSFASYGEFLYAGTRNSTTGGQIRRCQTCDGSDWTQVIGDGFGDLNNARVEGLISFHSRIFAITFNRTTGMEIWRSADGTQWTQANIDGFGDSNNWAPYWDNSATVFNDTLFIGTWNNANGGEVWQLLNQLYLPVVLR